MISRILHTVQRAVIILCAGVCAQCLDCFLTSFPPTLCWLALLPVCGGEVGGSWGWHGSVPHPFKFAFPSGLADWYWGAAFSLRACASRWAAHPSLSWRGELASYVYVYLRWYLHIYTLMFITMYMHLCGPCSLLYRLRVLWVPSGPETCQILYWCRFGSSWVYILVELCLFARWHRCGPIWVLNYVWTRFNFALLCSFSSMGSLWAGRALELSLSVFSFSQAIRLSSISVDLHELDFRLSNLLFLHRSIQSSEQSWAFQ